MEKGNLWRPNERKDKKAYGKSNWTCVLNESDVQYIHMHTLVHFTLCHMPECKHNNVSDKFQIFSLSFWSSTSSCIQKNKKTLGNLLWISFPFSIVERRQQKISILLFAETRWEWKIKWGKKCLLSWRPLLKWVTLYTHCNLMPIINVPSSQ